MTETISSRPAPAPGQPALAALSASVTSVQPAPVVHSQDADVGGRGVHRDPGPDLEQPEPFVVGRDDPGVDLPGLAGGRTRVHRAGVRDQLVVHGVLGGQQPTGHDEEGEDHGAERDPPGCRGPLRPSSAYSVAIAWSTLSRDARRAGRAAATTPARAEHSR